MRTYIQTVLATLLFGCIIGCSPPSDSTDGQQTNLPEESSGSQTYEDLVPLFHEFLEWRDPPTVAGFANYNPEITNKRRASMMQFQERLEAFSFADWEPAQKVDYLAVRAHFDEQDFILNITQPWSRNPVFYADQLLRLTFIDLPLEGEALANLQSQLRAIPGFLEQAKQNLVDVAGDYADLAIFNLTNSDGVGHTHPYRSIPPAGAIGWYEDLMERAAIQPELKVDISSAMGAVKDFHQWLVNNRDTMTAQNGVGEKALDWYLKYVKIIPHTSEEILVLAERERQRLSAYYTLERHRNRNVPEIKLPNSQEEYEQRLTSTDSNIRRFLVDEEFITIPDYIPSDWREMGFNVPWIKRSIPPNFWEQVQFRDPSPDHLHAVIPGHRFDTWVEKNLNHPIRRISFGDRREGWGVYLEEAALQTGLLDELPRARELIYVFGLWRAVRTIGDVRNQRNELTASETVDYWMSMTPWLDKGVARKYAQLRPAPGHGLHYTMGALQMYRLLADRQQQLGDDFVLKDFHDDLMSRGRVPLALIRYEMTGYEDDVRELWDRTPLSELK